MHRRYDRDDEEDDGDHNGDGDGDDDDSSEYGSDDDGINRNACIACMYA